MTRPLLSRPRRALPVLAVAALAVAGAGVASAASPSTGAGRSAAGAPACSTRGLVVWLNTMGDGYAGGVVYQVEFTNLSGHTCTLSGWPGVSAVNLRGRRVGQAAARDHGIPVRTVSLREGATVASSLRAVDALNFPPSPCDPTTAAGLRVYPPGQTASRVVPFPLEVCAGGVQTLYVRPVTR